MSGYRPVALSLALLAATALTQAHASSFALIYSFDNVNSGSTPYSLAAVDGTLYGFTIQGPNNQGPGNQCQCGTFYKLTPSGTETTLYAFTGGNLGNDADPVGVTQVLGRLYGTTFGEVFSFSLSGNEAITYTTHSAANSPNVFAGVAAPGGPLIVTADTGGVCATGSGYGAVFALDKGTSVSRILHSFCNGTGDGLYPNTPVVSVNGTLYGTTQAGGANQTGVIYSISPSGQESVVYSFPAIINRGRLVAGPLTYAGGKLYGTYTGPDENALFTVDAAGDFTVLHVFTKAEGAPTSGLVAAGTALYGVSSNALYSLDASGKFTIAHAFPGNLKSPAILTGGYFASSTPVYLGGAIYGTTQQGGASGVGAVYKYTP